MAPGAKRKSLDHTLASLPAPASGTRHDLRVIRKAFRKTMIVRVDGYLAAAARPRREDTMEGEVLVMRCGKWRRGRGGGSTRRRRAGGGGGAWRAMPPSLRSRGVGRLDFGLGPGERSKASSHHSTEFPKFCIFFVGTEFPKCEHY